MNQHIDDDRNVDEDYDDGEDDVNDDDVDDVDDGDDESSDKYYRSACAGFRLAASRRWHISLRALHTTITIAITIIIFIIIIITIAINLNNTIIVPSN